MVNNTKSRRPAEKRPRVMLEIRLPEIEAAGDSRTAYDHLYQETDISQRRSFYLWLADLFQFTRDDVYLDVSCGRGQLPAIAAARGIRAHGLDLSLNALRQGRRAPTPGLLVAGNGQRLPYPDNSFTVVSNIGSLEHYVDVEAGIREMSRILAPGGRAFVLVPNTFSLTYNIWIAFRKGVTHVDEQPIQRYAARREWQQMLESNGLTVQKTIKYERERPRTWQDLADHLQHPKKLLRLLFAPLVPLNLAFCFVFICRKPESSP